MKNLATAAIIAASMSSAHVSAQTLTVSITNLMNGMNLTPALVAAHPSGTSLFAVGTAASPELEALAEGGATGGLETILDATTAVRGSTAGLTAPGVTAADVMLNTDATPTNTSLTILAMLVPTNDAFIALNIDIPTADGTYTYHINVYDAGTEANDELAANMPDPASTADTGATVGAAGTDANGMVHIHRGALGDTDGAAGNSDLDSTIHRWLNPGAVVTVTVVN